MDEHRYVALYRQPRAAKENILLLQCVCGCGAIREENAEEFLEAKAGEGKAYILDCTPESEIKNDCTGLA